MVQADDPTLWKRTARRRLVLVAVAFALWVAAIEARLVYLQVYQRAYWAEKAEKQQSKKIVLPAQRGDILDRNGLVLAMSIDAFAVEVNPAAITPETAAAELCIRLGDCNAFEDWARLVEQLKSADAKGKRSLIVRHRITDEQARRVNLLRMPGVELQREPRRWYPNRELAANVLGVVGSENNGLEGVEKTYDKYLQGTPGDALRERDGYGMVFSAVGTPPVPGKTLELTLDAALQHITEQELKAGVIENEAASGAAIIADPMTGEIVAMASYPTFNPNSYSLYEKDLWRNRSVQTVYEPGSTFKIVTASAALDNNVVTPDTYIDTGNGTITIPGRKKIVKDTHHNGVIKFSEAIAVSSNIAAIRVGQRVGRERLGEYAKKFGIGERVSARGLAGEEMGLFAPPSSWSESTLASVSMGYEVSVTPLQMLMAACAVGNGGLRVVPHIVRAQIDGRTRSLVELPEGKRVITSKTSAELTAMMEGVVDHGTARRAKIPGFVVAGKTGTAQKNANGHYLDGEWTASFVGFVPSQHPVFAAIVVIDAPHGKMGHQGGGVAAPIFQRIVSAALKHRGIMPTLTPSDPVLVSRPQPFERLVSGAPSLTIAPAAPRTTDGNAAMPELRGYSGRAAVAILAKLGLSARLSGDGLVSDQEPAPGEPIAAGASCRLILTRQVREVASGYRP